MLFLPFIALSSHRSHLTSCLPPCLVFSRLSHTLTFLILSTMILLLLSLVFPTALALGINCRGSTFCQRGPSFLDPDIIFVFDALAHGTTAICASPLTCGPINDTDVYAPGAHILCLPQSSYYFGGIYAFAQGNVSAAGINGMVIKQKLTELRAHGCTICGSVPLSGNNDPDTEGILTVNHVARHVCVGVCPPTQYSASFNGSSSISAGLNDIASNSTATA